MMDEAVEHMRPDVHTEQSDDENPECVPHDRQRNPRHPAATTDVIIPCQLETSG